ncbi:glucokinase [Mycoplasma testudineum]|uniref:Glucokinase n=1 Tax=Mycoplasma testudineum TaxID=244584 RepID=A0A4R6I9U5_9MOLU|nr:ROK family protein [Mycoplasma testudineum]OYD26486.1 glucokinase [Mycoplasma testudineum]TDO18950.1 glucokinase [Mycoplasma testudineum]
MNKKFAAIDIGGTNVRFATFTNDDKIEFKKKFETNPNNYRETVAKIVSLIKEHNVSAIAIGIPGPADYPNGIILDTPNLVDWRQVNLREYFLSQVNLEAIVFENDANAMAFANHKFFKQQADDVTQFFTVSTGLGAGLIINNKVFTGSNYQAQEVAFAPLAPIAEKKYHHLSPYSLELFASGTGMSIRAKNLGQNWEAKDLFNKYESDEIAKKIIDQGIDTLARTIATAMAWVNPNLFVFGGSVSTYNNWFIYKAFEEAKKYTTPSHFDKVKVEIDQMGDDSALFGLYYLIQSKF